ncbi:MAG: amidohydrolase family protein, partial [Caulobacteraceae bacterium]
NWYEPVDTLLVQMDRCGVERAVLIQMLGRYENGYQQDCFAKSPDRFMSVVGIDPADAGGPDALRRLAGEGATGVRLRPDAPAALWSAAGSLGLAVSCVGTAAAVAAPAFAEVLAGASGPVVLEHLAGLARPDVGDLAALLGPVLALARFPNVYVKIPGLGQLAARGPRLPAEGPPFATDDAVGLLNDVVTAFGADRLMWGSDHPVVSSREGYANALAWTQTALGHLPEGDRVNIFGGVAQRVFGRR